jgi:hypothetical protein
MSNWTRKGTLLHPGFSLHVVSMQVLIGIYRFLNLVKVLGRYWVVELRV